MGQSGITAAVRAGVQALAPYAAVLAVCLFVLNGIFKVRSADLGVPFTTTSDGMVYVTWAKGMLENGWYLHNPALGAPAGQDMHDYPVPDLLHLLSLKLLSLVYRDAGTTVNVFFLLGFPLAALTAFFALRRLQVSAVPAGVAALLYAFLPYHLLRSEKHLFLSAYYLVPLAVLVVLGLYRDARFLHRPSAAGALVVCLLVGLAGVYYAFFTCFFLGVAAAAACCYRRKVCPLLPAGILIAVITGGVVASVSPTLIYHHQHGPNPEAVDRAPEGAELYGLKLTQLLLPVNRHRVEALAHARAVYSNSPATPLITENEFATLGLAGAVGFLILVGRLLWRRPDTAPQLLDALAVLNVFAVLLATVGGFGSLFAFYVTPMIRAYNRVSVFLGFFALAAVALLLDALWRRFAVRSWPGRALGVACAAGLLGMCLLDQVPPGLFLTHVAREGQYRSEGAFVHQIEAAVPPGTMVFQLPYTPFPESPPPGRMFDYDHFRAYLHSHTLRWSYGAMRGRAGDRWQREVAGKPLPEMVEALTLAGFGGIYLDRLGFADDGTAVEAQLTRLLGVSPLVSGDGRLSFFSLSDYTRRLRQEFSDGEWQERRDTVVPPLPCE
jgi:phosphoglycerol transferase